MCEPAALWCAVPVRTQLPHAACRMAGAGKSDRPASSRDPGKNAGNERVIFANQRRFGADADRAKHGGCDWARARQRGWPSIPGGRAYSPDGMVQAGSPRPMRYTKDRGCPTAPVNRSSAMATKKPGQEPRLDWFAWNWLFGPPPDVMGGGPKRISSRSGSGAGRPRYAVRCRAGWWCPGPSRSARHRSCRVASSRC